MIEQLSQAAIEAACRAAGMEIPPTQSHAIHRRKAASRVHPCDRKKETTCHYGISIDAEIPRKAGVYFFWRSGVPFYVGQAVDLQQRLATHDKKKYCDQVAWVFCEQNELNFVESFYISVLRPIVNFGSIKSERIDEGQTYYHVERIGDLIISRTQSFNQPQEIPLPAGAVIKFPGR